MRPRHDNKIVMGDLNAKVGREDRYRRIVGKDSLHERCNNNGERDRKSTRLNSSHRSLSRMPSSA